MSFNDGRQLLVFGLSFAQHDNRKMQQLLRHYDKLPDNPGSRASLFVQLNKVARELMADETAQDHVQQLTDWMTNGGDFPLGAAPAPTPANPGDQPQAAHGVNNGYHPSYANLGRHYGRGRTVSGDWEENNYEEHEEDEDEYDEEGMDEDEHMHDPIEGFPRLPGRHRLDHHLWRPAFSGPGRTLDDPSGQDGPAVADNEHGAAGSMDVEGQVADQPQNQPGGFGPEHSRAALRDLDNQPQRHDDDVSIGSEDFREDEPYEDDSSQEIECPICLEDYPRSKFPKHSTITEFCDHPDKACLNCLDSSITAIIERGALHLLACPICPQRLTRRDVKEYASPPVYERYKYLKEQSEIPGHYISCTNPSCGGSQPHEIEDPKMICNHCGSATCAKHRRPWHEGLTCREFDLDDAQIERLEEEEATAKLLSGEAMSICPKCGQGVTKSDGCDHMRCQCGQEWCYVVSKPPETPGACWILNRRLTKHAHGNSARARTRT